jgi:hypothetical protein
MPVSPGKFEFKNTVTTAAVGDGRAAIVEATTSHASITSGNLVGVRAHAIVPTGTTIDGGAFVIGGQAKLTFSGTAVMNHADCRVAGGFSQLDCSSGTYTTGQLSGHWVDMGASASASAVSTKFGGQGNILRLTNTTSANTNAIIYSYGDADYWMDIGAPGGTSDYFVVGSEAPGTAGGYLKLLVAGETKYIALFDATS